MTPRHNLSHELKKDKRSVRRQGLSSLMSDTKWRALFAAIEDAGIDVLQIIVKFVDVAGEQTMGLPWLDAPHAFVDSMAFGPFPLVGIEWIEFPRIVTRPRANNVPAEQLAQDVDAIRAAIVATGKLFRLEETQRGFRVIGHAR